MEFQNRSIRRSFFSLLFGKGTAFVLWLNSGVKVVHCSRSASAALRVRTSFTSGSHFFAHSSSASK